MSNNQKTWLFIAAGIVVVAVVGNMQNDRKPTADNTQETATKPSICGTLSAESDATMMSLVYKIDNGYMVYVQPDWYGLKIDQKQMFTGYIARCKLSGAARFLDASTGKLLARWGDGRYVSSEE